MNALRVLLAGIVDYAGLFPPAQLGMAEAVHNYATYLREDEAWALGRFIVPVSRLKEFEQAVERLPLQEGEAEPWHISALLGVDADADMGSILDFNHHYARERSPRAAVIDTIEVKAAGSESIRKIMTAVPSEVTAYFEIPAEEDPQELVETTRDAGARAKVRTGGVTPDMFPSGQAIVRFITTCSDAGVAFKATAGLHHPLRSLQRLRYDPDSPCAVMWGFMNVFLCAALIHAGDATGQAVQLLEEQSLHAFRFEDEAISWRDYRFTGEDLRRARDRLAISFGSCSFREPIDDLKAMHLL